ncbi:diacylglycerol kinase family protein [Patescibacteria group bacterium]
MRKNLSHKQSLKNALAGLWQSFQTEKNLRVMVVISLVTLGAGFLLGISLLEFTIIVWAIFAVIAVEMINTSLEAITDLVKEEWHLQAKKAKDVSAGMVLLAAVSSGIIGILIFLPKIYHLFF